MASNQHEHLTKVVLDNQEGFLQKTITTVRTSLIGTSILNLLWSYETSSE